MEILLASGNAHKRQEIAAILHEHDIRLPEEAGFRFDFDETGLTFLDNALGKGLALFRDARRPVLADDSGLAVAALDGDPGVLSARYGSDLHGRPLSAEEKNALLLRNLEGTADRTARFICCMVLILSEERFFVVQETFEGLIAREPAGSGGFGYDPVFFLPEYGKSVAELPDAEKNRISHRGKATLRIRDLLAGISGSM